jgi:hypothetical protein
MPASGEGMMSVELIEDVGAVQRRAATKAKAGSELRVSLAESDNGAFVNVRKWIVAPPLELFREGKKPRSDYTGPDGFHGLDGLQPSEALELAELLTVAARAAEMMQEREYGTGETA